MAAPDLTATGERLYDGLESLTQEDEANGYPLALWSGGFAAILDPVADLVSDQDDGTPGYAAYLFAPDTEPAEWLDVTDFFTGTTPYPAVDEAGHRLRIKETDGRFRGTPKAIKGAARQFLTGTQYVYILPRDQGPLHYTVVVRASEVPAGQMVLLGWDAQAPALTWDTATAGLTWNSSTLYDALEEQNPGLNFALLISAGQVWDELTSGVTWNSVAPGVTWDGLSGTATI